MFHYLVLIVPSGIETNSVTCVLNLVMVLIVPSGIETWFKCKLCYITLGINCT